MTTTQTQPLRPELIEQLLALFGTAKNAHLRLGLTPLVDLPVLQRALSRPLGYPITPQAAQLVEARWAEWRRTFLDDPEVNYPLPHEAAYDARSRGDYYHEDVARDQITGQLVASPPRFTLLDNPGKHL